MGLLPTLSIVVLAVAVAGVLAYKLRLPPALGYLGVGLIASATPAIAHAHHALEVTNELAILVLLFAIGLELDLRRLREALAKSALTLPFDVGLAAVAVAGAVTLLGFEPIEAIAMGLATCLSSTLFGERLTSGGPGEVRQRVIGTLLAQDVAAAGLLAVISVLGSGGGAWWTPMFSIGKLGFLFILLTTVALLVVPRALDAISRTHVHELVVLAGAAAVVLFGALGAWAGSAELGALVAGVAAAEAGSRFVVRNDLKTFRGLALAAVFFSTGAQVHLPELASALGPAALVAIAFLAAKLLVHIPAAYSTGMGFTNSLRNGVALGTIGEFTIILIAAAEAAGVAHPQMRPIGITAVLYLLVVSALLDRNVERISAAAHRLPSRVVRPASWVIRTLTKSREPVTKSGEGRAQIRSLLANGMLLLAWILIAATGGPWVVDQFPAELQDLAAIGAIGGGAIVAAPFAWNGFRAYHGLLWQWVGLRPGERKGAGKARVLIVDAWVVGTAVLVLIPITLTVPATLPVLIFGAAAALGIGLLAWRRLSVFHDALTGSMVRVLGHDPAADAFLDKALARYSWGLKFAAVAVPRDSPLARQTILQSRVLELTGALVAVVQRRGKEIVNPEDDFVILPGDTLVFVGNGEQLEKAEALVVSHGEALRLSAQSAAASLREIPVPEGSPTIGLKLGELHIKRDTGALIVGLWRENQSHPLAYDHDLYLRPDDRLIMLGTELQLSRAHEFLVGAEGDSFAEPINPKSSTSIAANDA